MPWTELWSTPAIESAKSHIIVFIMLTSLKDAVSIVLCPVTLMARGTNWGSFRGLSFHTAFQRCLVSHAYRAKPNYLCLFIYLLRIQNVLSRILKIYWSIAVLPAGSCRFQYCVYKRIAVLPFSCSLLPGLPDISAHCSNIGLQGWEGSANQNYQNLLILLSSHWYWMHSKTDLKTIHVSKEERAYSLKASFSF